MTSDEIQEQFNDLVMGHLQRIEEELKVIRQNQLNGRFLEDFSTLQRTVTKSATDVTRISTLVEGDSGLVKKYEALYETISEVIMPTLTGTNLKQQAIIWFGMLIISGGVSALFKFVL